MKNCINEETLQAWVDGELAADQAANVAAHLNTCAQCAAVARTVEAESVLLSEALAPEFAAPVPTEALRQRVDLAVGRLHDRQVRVSRTSRWSVFAEFFSFRPLAYASAAATIVLVAIIGFVYLKNHKTTSVANNNQPQVGSPESPKESPKLVKDQSPGQPMSPQAPKPSYIAAVHKPKRVRRTGDAEPDATSLTWQTQQYEGAIAKLNEALKTQPAMRPSLQVEYEYNLAVIDSTIKTTRDAAKKNPKDPLANQFMLAAYQSKVDFMNQIADARAVER
ncbi:MAG TPA: zf-HC2 domain-containing protein [Pyrinomonadaceae bacterium]|nr:zf-HC2 domain-containing protein [Pyrinomonadaceae bacterium]